MNEQHLDDDVAELLTTDRELTRQEMDRLRRVGKKHWSDLAQMVQDRARNAYSVADPEDFERCVTQHMSASDWGDMVVSGIFMCPVCARLLKDRQSPVATAVLLERTRVRKLWEEVERSSPEQLDARMAVFRRALGLS